MVLAKRLNKGMLPDKIIPANSPLLMGLGE
jgi:hypothetical protein